MLSLALLLSSADAKQYYAAPSGTAFVQDKCWKSKKGESGSALHPAVMEFVLSQPESFVHSHFAGMAAWQAAGSPTDGLNEALIAIFNQDLAAARQGTTLPGDPVGNARAVAQTTADAANAAIAKKGCASWTWGWFWEHEGDRWRLAGPGGNISTNVFVAPSESRVYVHIWSAKGFNTNVTQYVAVYDLSGVSGAFDPSADLTYEQVAEGAQRGEPQLVLTYAEAGYISGHQ